MKRTILSTLLLFITFISMNVFSVNAQNENYGKKKMNMKPNTESSSIRKDMNSCRFSDKWRIHPIGRNQKKQIAKAGADGKEIYGWSLSNADSWGQADKQGLRKFYSNEPDKLQIIGGATTEFIEAGAFAEDSYYLFALYDGSYPKGLYSINMETGGLTLVADYMYDETALGAIDMTYDYSTSTMYMLVNAGRNAGLRSVDLQTGKQKEIIADLGYFFRTIAADKNGNIYGIASVGEENDGRLFKIDIATSKCTDIGSTGISPLMYQSMDFDRNNNTLYWASYNYMDESVLYTINTSDAHITSLGTIGNNDQMVALHIPFDLCDPKAPAAVAEFTVAPDTQGANKATLTWSNPDKTYDGSQLSAISKIEILRNEQVVETINNIIPGTSGQWEDSQITVAGIYKYKIMAYNDKGAGVISSKSVYIGHDLPAASENAEATRIDKHTIDISWKPVTKGMNGGYLDMASIRYRIIRINDEKMLADNLATTDYKDSSITTLARYSYSIETYNTDGTGANVISNGVVTGPTQEIPFESNFNSQDEMDVWEVEDRDNDNSGWQVGYNTDTGKTEFAYIGGIEEGNDWLISPMLDMNANGHYKVIADAHCYNPAHPESFNILLVDGETMELKADLGKFKVTNIEPEPYRVNIDMNKNDYPTGEYRIVIKGSEPENFGLFIQSVAIGNDEDGNIRGSIYDTSDEPIEGMTVSINEEFTTRTNADGEFEIKFVPVGNYTLTATKLGYKDLTKIVTVSKWETINEELTVEKRAEYKLSGTIKNEYGESLPNATIEITGYNTYSAKTGTDGSYEFSIYEAATDYTVTASKTNYETNAGNVKIISKDISKDFVLNDNILPPHQVKAEVKTNALLTWEAPAENISIDYSSEMPGYGFGSDEYDGNTIAGIIYRQPISIEKVSWQLLAEDETCNIIILDLDDNGEPTSNVLYMKENVPNTPYEISEYTLPQIVKANKGCAITISSNTSYLMLNTFSPDDAHPFMEHTNVYCENYTSDPFEYVESYGDDYRENFAIFAEGTTIAEENSPKVTYNIYRGNDLLNNPTVSTTAYEDKSWNTLPDGDYIYSVEAVYRNNKHSEKAVTNPITKDASHIDTKAIETYTITLSGDRREILISETVPQIAVYTTSGDLVARANHVDRIAIAPIKGIYIVRITDANENYTRKLTIN